MKSIFALAVVAIVYFVLARQTPVAEVKSAVIASELTLTSGPRDSSPVASALKRPFDRTHAALDLAKQRNGAGEF